MAMEICLANGGDPHRLTWHHNGEIMEPYGDEWVYYLPEARRAVAHGHTDPRVIEGLARVQDHNGATHVGATLRLLRHELTVAQKLLAERTPAAPSDNKPERSIADET